MQTPNDVKAARFDIIDLMAMGSKGKVVVAMSGGVDSSVAACLLREQGYDVMGLFMRTGAGSHDPVPDPRGDRHRGCCSATDAADARFVAGELGIPFYALNFEREFDGLIDYFVDEYARGRTPNPCVVCNQRLKFGRIFDYAKAVGADFVATGHYARIDARDSRPALRRAVDERKDQTYVLFGIERDLLHRLLFPIGHLTKNEVRAEARRFGLPVSEKPESVEICFVPDQNYARLVRERRPEAFAPGEVFNTRGQRVGSHAGTPNFTIGQRRGLGIAAGVPMYVVNINTQGNTVTLGTREEVMGRSLVMDETTFLIDDAPERFRANVKIRYLHRASPATVRALDAESFQVDFDEAQPAMTPGQAAVIYDDEGFVLGGGWIREQLRD